MATATLLPPPRATFFDANGAPLAGGFVYMYVPGGTTPKLTWQDAGEATPNSNPIVLDANGSCIIYGAGAYQRTVTDSLGNAVPAYSGLTQDVVTSSGISPVMAPVVGADTISAAWEIFGQIPASGFFFENEGALVLRFNDRVFVGDATVNDGDQPNVAKDWLSETTGLGYAVMIAQMAVLSSFGQIGFATASRTSDAQAPGVESFGSAIGLGAWGFNDKIDGANSWDAWATYVEARTAQENQGTTWGMELDIMSYGGHLTPSTPYVHFVPWGAFGISVASGAGQSGANDATVALAIQNNGAKFLTGIKFDDNSITGADGTSSGGSGEAIAFARGHLMQWYLPDGTKGASIESIQTTGGQLALTFQDNGLQFASAGQPLLGSSITPPALGFTNLSLLVNNTTSGVVYQQIFLGAPDSGGTGTRALIVPN